MLTRLAVKLALVSQRTTGALQEEVGRFATGKFGLGAEITCHGYVLLSLTRHDERASPADVVVGPNGGLAPSHTARERAGARVSSPQIRRRFCGRHPLCGTGVTSEIELMRMPSEASARTDDSRPGPGPFGCLDLRGIEQVVTISRLSRYLRS